MFNQGFKAGGYVFGVSLCSLGGRIGGFDFIFLRILGGAQQILSVYFPRVVGEKSMHLIGFNAALLGSRQGECCPFLRENNSMLPKQGEMRSVFLRVSGGESEVSNSGFTTRGECFQHFSKGC